MPAGYEIFTGNAADVTTVEEMVELMEKKYGQSKRIWVMDRGMISEDNIDFLRARQARYLVGTHEGVSPEWQLVKTLKICGVGDRRCCRRSSGSGVGFPGNDGGDTSDGHKVLAVA